MIIAEYNKQILVIIEERFQIHVPSYCKLIVENANISFMFSQGKSAPHRLNVMYILIHRHSVISVSTTYSNSSLLRSWWPTVSGCHRWPSTRLETTSSWARMTAAPAGLIWISPTSPTTRSGENAALMMTSWHGNTFHITSPLCRVSTSHQLIPHGFATQRATLLKMLLSWWHHNMETLYALLSLCAGNPPVTGGFPTQRTSYAIPTTHPIRMSFLRCHGMETISV